MHSTKSLCFSQLSLNGLNKHCYCCEQREIEKLKIILCIHSLRKKQDWEMEVAPTESEKPYSHMKTLYYR